MHDRNLELIIYLVYKNTRESLGELENAKEHSPRVPTVFPFSQTSTCVAIWQLDYELEFFIESTSRSKTNLTPLQSHKEAAPSAPCYATHYLQQDR